MIKDIFTLALCIAAGLAAFFLAPFFVPICIGIVIFAIVKFSQEVNDD